MYLQTDRLVIRPLTAEDHDNIIELLLDPVVGQTYMVPEFASREEAETLFFRLLDLSLTDGRYVAAITRQGCAIGIVNEVQTEGNSIELGYAILPRYHNCGYGTEMLRGAIAYFFAHGFDTVLAGAFEENAASLRIMEKSGMTRQEQTEEISYRGRTYRCINYAAKKRSNRKYYEAYDERYLQMHGKKLQWFDENPSAIVGQILEAYGITKQHKLLELGCGEGRDAAYLLRQGYDLTATDVSPAAIGYCKQKFCDYVNCFAVLDCVAGQWSEEYDFIYAVAVIHMLVVEEDRNGFYSFIREHLKKDGLALICSMGDGRETRQTDPQTAFERQDRVHEQSGTPVKIASTSCRMVSMSSFEEEIKTNVLEILQLGHTSVEPDFPQMIYAVVKQKNKFT